MKINRKVMKKNPLKNLGFMVKLNPYAITARRHAILAMDPKIKAKMLKSKKAAKKVAKKPKAAPASA